jgi:FkbM family methyltransferase
MTVADVGANKGDFTLLAAQLVGPSGRVIAVEPGPENLQWLERSVDVSGYRNVECVEAALGEEPGTAPLHLGEFSGWHTMLTGGTGATVDVTVRTLDSLGPLNAVKIDVEGFEEQVLRGGAATLRDPGLRVVFLDLHPHLGVSVERTLALLTDAGLSVTELGEREALAVRR